MGGLPAEGPAAGSVSRGQNREKPPHPAPGSPRQALDSAGFTTARIAMDSAPPMFAAETLEGVGHLDKATLESSRLGVWFSVFAWGGFGVPHE